jgi:hypothetical protein
MSEVNVTAVACSVTGTLLTNDNGVWTTDDVSSPLFGRRLIVDEVDVVDAEDDSVAAVPTPKPKPEPAPKPAAAAVTEASVADAVSTKIDVG